MSQHSTVSLGARHPIHNFSWANSAARTGAALVSADLGKVGLQVDTNTYYLITGVSPNVFAVVGGGGGGGGSLKWRAGATDPSPVEEIEFDQDVFKFVAGDGQTLLAIVRVPASYNAGSPISMDMDFYSPSTSNNFQFSTVSTLIRTGTDAVSSTTNQNTSTPAALTNSGAANKLRSITFELSNSTGLINSVAVAAGDEIRIKLTRSAVDTDTADVRMVPDSTQVRFS